MFGEEQKFMLRLIDLFSGAGGLTLEFTELSSYNFVSVWANDIDKDAVATYMMWLYTDTR
jgi:site-specific DNA-cytosine methylase